VKELASLEASLLDLLSILDTESCPLILGGGYGLYLRRIQVEKSGTRTMLQQWPQARSTNDLDLFLRPELLVDSSRLLLLKSALDRLGYKPQIGAENYQFRKDDPQGNIARGIKIDLLTGPRRFFENYSLKVDERRVRPQPSIGIHAHPTDEAITLEQQLERMTVTGATSDGSQIKSFVHLPHPFTYAMMKLFAFRDQSEDSTRDFGSHHALDLYSIIAMMTEQQWDQSQAIVSEYTNAPEVKESRDIVRDQFSSLTSRGLLVMQSNPYCTNDLQLQDFTEILGELL